MRVLRFKVARMVKFLIFITFVCFISRFQVTHCNETELDITELSEFLSKVPFNLGQIFAELEKNETNYQAKVFYGSQCFIDIQRIFLGMATKKLWAFKGKATNSGQNVHFKKKTKAQTVTRVQVHYDSRMNGRGGIVVLDFEYKRRTRKLHL